jgi:hypothetical protein
MLSRRELIGKAAVGAAATLAVSAAGIASARVLQGALDGRAEDRDGRHRAATDGPADGGGGQPAAPPAADAVAIASPPPWELLRPLVAGSAVGHGWRLVDLSPVRHGSSVVTLENARGRARRVHLCRNDGTPQGIIYTRRLDLVLMNEGNGDLPTEEGLAQAVAALAHVVAANETTGPDQLAELLPHAERVQRFAATDGTPAMEGKLR